MTVDDAAWCRCTPGEQRSARVKVGGRGTQGYSRHTLLGTGEHAEQLLKAKPPKSGAWLRGQMSVQGLCAQVEGAVIFSQQEECTQCLRGKQADVRAQGLAQGRRASTCRSRLLHVGRGRGGRRHAPGGAAITQHHRCTETDDAHAQMANAQPAQSDVWGAWQCVRTWVETHSVHQRWPMWPGDTRATARHLVATRTRRTTA
jgi:hypothetical protein